MKKIFFEKRLVYNSSINSQNLEGADDIDSNVDNVRSSRVDDLKRSLEDSTQQKSIRKKSIEAMHSIMSERQENSDESTPERAIDEVIGDFDRLEADFALDEVKKEFERIKQEKGLITGEDKQEVIAKINDKIEKGDWEDAPKEPQEGEEVISPETVQQKTEQKSQEEPSVQTQEEFPGDFVEDALNKVEDTETVQAQGEFPGDVIEEALADVDETEGIPLQEQEAQAPEKTKKPGRMKRMGKKLKSLIKRKKKEKAAQPVEPQQAEPKVEKQKKSKKLKAESESETQKPVYDLGSSASSEKIKNIPKKPLPKVKNADYLAMKLENPEIYGSIKPSDRKEYIQKKLEKFKRGLDTKKLVTPEGRQAELQKAVHIVLDSLQDIAEARMEVRRDNKAGTLWQKMKHYSLRAHDFVEEKIGITEMKAAKGIGYFAAAGSAALFGGAYLSTAGVAALYAAPAYLPYKAGQGIWNYFKGSKRRLGDVYKKALKWESGGKPWETELLRPDMNIKRKKYQKEIANRAVKKLKYQERKFDIESGDTDDAMNLILDIALKAGTDSLKHLK